MINSQTLYKNTKKTMGNLKTSWHSKEKLISYFNAVESNNTLTFDKKSIAKIFKDLFSNLVELILNKLPNGPNKHNLESVFQ